MTLASGYLAEKKALGYLKSQGLKLVKKNYQCSFGRYVKGEVDLIMIDQQHLVFIEVRLRKNPYFSGPLESITKKKQLILIRTATQFIQSHQEYQHQPCRFDAVGIDNNEQIHWIRNAFQV